MKKSSPLGIFLIGMILFATSAFLVCGQELWPRRYNGPGNNTDYAFALAVDSSSENVYVTGPSHGSGTHQDYATVAYDSSGNELWAARYNGPGNDDDRALALAVDLSSGNVYVTGRSWGSGTTWDYATVAYDGSGNELWATRYNGPGNNLDSASAIALDSSSGDIYVTGVSSESFIDYDYATVKYGPELDPFGQIENLIDKVKSLVNAGVLNQGQGNALIVKLQAAVQNLNNGNEAAACNELQAFINQVNAYVNSGNLTQEEAQPLIDAANSLINELCG